MFSLIDDTLTISSHENLPFTQRHGLTAYTRLIFSKDRETDFALILKSRLYSLIVIFSVNKTCNKILLSKK